MNILDPRNAVQRVKHDVAVFVLGLLLVIGLIIVCMLLAVYLGTVMGYQTVFYPSLSNYTQQQQSFHGYHDHRIGQWS